jgi:mRNA interferase MazF
MPTRRLSLMASVDDLWFVDFGNPYPGEPAHHRPALVLGPPDTFGPDFPFVIVTPLTTTRRGLSLHVEVEATRDTGLDDTSYIQCELIRSVNRRRLVHRLGVVDLATSDRVADIVKTLLNH